MTGEQWLAVAGLAISFAGSVAGGVAWITHKQSGVQTRIADIHSQLIGELGAIRTSMAHIEKDWIDRMASVKADLQGQVEQGPAWLKPLMEAQAILLEKAITESATAIEVAKQHGTEMNLIRDAIKEQAAELRQLLAIFKDKC